jgi:hypothetical protein
VLPEIHEGDERDVVPSPEDPELMVSADTIALEATGEP